MTNKQQITEVVEAWFQKENDEGGIWMQKKAQHRLCVDGELDVPALIDSITKLLEERDERLIAGIDGMFSVYPEDTIHDFDGDEELVSKKQVLSLIKNTN